MPNSRRSFIKSGALFGASLALPLNLFAQKGGAALQPVGGYVVPTTHFNALAQLTRASFEKCLGGEFILFTRNRGAVGMKLSRVEDISFKGDGKPVKSRKGPIEGFSLIFTSRTQLGQDVYSLGHTYTGYFALLVVPVGSRDGTYYYEALINRLV